MSQNEKQTIEKIRDSYTKKDVGVTKLEELKKLDSSVKNPARLFGYTYGAIGSLVLGTGMTMAMGVLGGATSVMMPVGILIGVLGIAMVSTTYPIFNKILSKRKQKYAQDIIAKSEELLGEKNN